MVRSSADDGSPALRLFGRPTLTHGGRTTPFLAERPFQLLAALALRAGEWIARDEIAALFWPRHEPSAARRNLRNLVFKARALAGHASFETTDEALRWSVRTDMEAFDAALAEDRFDEALDLAGHERLADIDSGAGEVFADRVGTARRQVLARLQRALHRRLGDDGVAAARRRAWAEQLLALDPCDEVAFAALITLDLDEGRTLEVRQRLRSFELEVAELLGVEPSTWLRALLTSADDGQDAADPTLVGRRIERSRLRDLLAAPPPCGVAIVGPGGAGKSTLGPVPESPAQDGCRARARLARGQGAPRAAGHNPFMPRRLVVLPGRPHSLGSRPPAGGTGFSVYSRSARRVELLLYDHVDDAQPAQVIPLDAAAHRTWHYWHAFVRGVRPGQLYAWRAHGC